MFSQGFRWIAHTILFDLKAKFAVTLVPLLCDASITKVPFPKAATMRFLAKKLSYSAFISSLYSVKANPFSLIILLNSFLFTLGYILLKPQGSTAIVFPPYFRQVLCTKVSVPMAKPAHQRNIS